MILLWDDLHTEELCLDSQNVGQGTTTRGKHPQERPSPNLGLKEMSTPYMSHVQDSGE